MNLLPIKEHLHENTEFIGHPDCKDSLGMCIDFYQRVGFNPPWICYYVQIDDQLVAAAAFKGKPVENKVEIAYGTFSAHQNKGIGTKIAETLVRLALEADPLIRVTAQTLMEENYSTKILRKNNFVIIGKAMDDDEGEVWEWEYQKG
ncbi:GNAT family N-acetyltransferase [Mucilaginibacter ginsenosidivorans]|uniref:GNAT family N-acetyltransferase n=1 Tax=Mucilaginibacter ginsenosidivorans TaxID=398053 RepID=A0A5B8UXP6_9SPHI|nr:GNAT family protein [Mucilaginibacter ginsenosidivorans]QEC63937.1 GNAT family N-acetyltransferase [Mucilaginibacter ginsenosidivorans]